MKRRGVPAVPANAAAKARARSRPGLSRWQKGGAAALAAAALVALSCVFSGGEEPASSSTSSSSVEVQLMDHMRRRGAKVHFSPHDFEGGLRGAAADADIAPEGLLAELPLREVFYADNVADEVRRACKALPCNVSRAVLALGIAYERARGAASRFAPFVKTLPTQVSNFVSWPGPLLRLMETAMPGARGFLSTELWEMRGANKLLRSPLDDSDLIWGIAMVQTRAFGTESSGGALVPLATFLNHHWDPEMAVPMPKCDMQAKRCHIRAGAKRITRGEQVFFHYRPWSNLQLLIRYGFAVPDNPWGPEVKFPPLEAESMPAWLAEAGCAGASLRLSARAGGAGGLPLPDPVLRCARAAVLAQDSSEADLPARWAAGEFERLDAGASGALRAIAEACAGAAARWTEGEGPEVLAAAAAAPATGTSAAVLQAVRQDLELLEVCRTRALELAGGGAA